MVQGSAFGPVMQNNIDDLVRLAADGSSLGNPGPGGWCFYVDIHHWAAGGTSSKVTNNQMELMAVLMALKVFDGRHLEFSLDSQYAINCLTKWHHGWSRKNWRTASGSPVLNSDLIKEAVGLISSRAILGLRTEFVWVKGHAGNKLNEAADFRARAAAKKALSDKKSHVIGPLSGDL